ncbi:MAG TPA: hypothetical protein VIF11_06650 [Methylomirabilota bacterium]|jgi:hypothetical protein
MGRLDRRALVLLVLGVAALAVSPVLTPTPDAIRHFHHGRTNVVFRHVDGGTHAVDYAILALRVFGIPALIAGVYLTYRSWRPDRLRSGEDLHGQSRDTFDDMPLQGGDPGGRGGIQGTL